MKDKKITASFVSLGCFKNIVDTEVLGGLLEQKNIQIVSSYEESDWQIINTCGFIRDAKEESIAEILGALEKKEKGEIKHVAVVGCLTQRYLKDLVEEFKGADILWGVNDFEQLAGLIAENKKAEYLGKKLFLYNENFKRIITTTPNVTFIKISEGCNMTCSFCAIPQIRGPYRSREIDSIVKEAAKYREMGFREINLISQNSTYFGKDRKGKSQLPQLLKEISKLNFSWVRVLYLMPEEVNGEIIDAFSLPSMVPYFDLPFQHVSANILKRMNRGGGVEKNVKLIKKIRGKYKDAVIRSSFIVGFPGETERNFKELLEFTERTGVERIGVFGFSEEEGTGAFLYKERVSPEIIESREQLLMDISDRNMEIYNEKLIDTVREFIPLGPWEGGMTVGRIMSQSPETDGVTLVNETFADNYNIYKIKITGFKNESLYGEMI
jgi:ribosomal protein S12 methylthiotransferase